MPFYHGLFPPGEYDRVVSDVNGVKRTVIVENSFHRVEPSPQTWQVFASLLDGFEMQAGIIAFLLIIGGAFQILNDSKAIDAGILSFLRSSRRLERYGMMRKLGVNRVIIASVIVLFSLFGAVFGMSEETLAFVIIVVPLAISMGYDSITGLCMVYVAAHVGFSGAVLNPFTIGIAQGLSDVPLFSGFEYRLVCWLVLTLFLIGGVLWYAGKIRKNPVLSPMYKADEYWRKREAQAEVRIEYAASRRAWCIYFLMLTALFLFSWHYPQTEFRVGAAASAFVPCRS